MSNPIVPVTPAPGDTPTTTVLAPFVTAVAWRYHAPSRADQKRIQAHIQELTSVPNRSFLEDILLLKILLPVESRDLVICGIPEAIDFIGKVRAAVTTQYYHEHLEHRTCNHNHTERIGRV